MSARTVSNPRRNGKTSTYRRTLVRALADLATELDAEANRRAILDGLHDRMIVDEIRRAAGIIRAAATFALQARMPVSAVEFYLAGGLDYLGLIRSADARGVIV